MKDFLCTFLHKKRVEMYLSTLKGGNENVAVFNCIIPKFKFYKHPNKINVYKYLCPVYCATHCIDLVVHLAVY